MEQAYSTQTQLDALDQMQRSYLLSAPDPQRSAQRVSGLKRFERELKRVFDAHYKLLSHFPSISERSLDRGLGFVSYTINSKSYVLNISGEMNEEALEEYRSRSEDIYQSLILRVSSILAKYGICSDELDLFPDYDGYFSVSMILNLKKYVLDMHELEVSELEGESVYWVQAKFLVNDYFAALVRNQRLKDHQTNSDLSYIKGQKTFFGFMDDLLSYAMMFFD